MDDQDKDKNEGGRPTAPRPGLALTVSTVEPSEEIDGTWRGLTRDEGIDLIRQRMFPDARVVKGVGPRNLRHGELPPDDDGNGTTPEL